VVFVGAMYLILYLCRRSVRKKREVSR